MSNTINRPNRFSNRNGRLVSHQTATTKNQTPATTSDNDVDEVDEVEDEDDDEEEEEGADSKVEDYILNDRVLGSIMQGGFTIDVKVNRKNEKTGKVEKVSVYKRTKENPEPFTYKQVASWQDYLMHLGAKLSDDKIQFLGEAFVDKDDEGNETPESLATAKALAKLVTQANLKLRADAKQAAYAGIVNKNKPLEGAQKLTAIARTVRDFVKLSNGMISPEAVIEVLKSKNAVPADYTVEDYESTSLRNPKGAKK